MTALITQVRALVAAQQMIAPGPPIVVAVSGGPDSLCLLHVLAALREDLGVTLHVAHLDHMIRGAESAAEAEFVADLARRWGLPATIASADVPGLARAAGANLHAAARDARYRFLARVAHACGAQAVAVAHHADDQAETVLMHLLRGAGPEGLRGMRPVVPYDEWTADLETSRQADKESAARSLSPCLLVSPALIRPLQRGVQLAPRRAGEVGPALALARQRRPHGGERRVDEGLLLGADSGGAAERGDDMRIILDQPGQQIVPDAVARGRQILVARVAARIEAVRGAVALNLGASNL